MISKIKEIFFDAKGVNILFISSKEEKYKKKVCEAVMDIYKKWNKKIKIVKFSNWQKLKKKFDLIIVGTPPNTNLNLLKKCLKIIN